jgi:hypothetical protein
MIRALIGVLLIIVAAGCGSSSTGAVIDPGDGGSYTVDISAEDFVDVVDNPLFPLPVGARWAYESVGGGDPEHIDVVVLDETREVMGIAATVVRDTVKVGDEVIEDTYDWYAQDQDGNVWYLGEDTAEYENGEVTSTEGSWEAGVNGALPGIIMKAAPRVGDAYRQEYLEGEAEDLAKVVRLDESQQLSIGSLTGLVVIQEWTPLSPDVVEEKYYAAGLGNVLEVMTVGGGERVELVDHSGL